ncbi:MAG: Dabb family protein [Phycisphaerales bacterium]
MLVGATACLAACSTQPASVDGSPTTGRLDSPRLPEVQHVVLLRLKDPLDTPDLVRACNALAEDVPSVRSAFAGLHVEIGRNNVDRDYDLCFIVGFDTVGGYREYLEHPAHLQLLADWRDRLEWIRVVDARDVPG